MARASRPTLLSLDRFARIFQISPVHFAGAHAGNTWPHQGTCDRVWPQWAWQNHDVVSREEVAQAIQDAEESIAQVLGFFPAPRWVSQEVQSYPRPSLAERLRQGHDARGLGRSFKTRWGRVIQPGRRMLTTVQLAAAVVYSDSDSDGFFETATITVPLPTGLTDARAVKVYFAGQSGAPEWEIRPLRKRVVDTIGGTITLTADSWLFISPALWEAYPTVDGFQVTDISTTANFVTTVDVYWEQTDATTNPTAQLLWGNERMPQPTAWPLLCGNCGGAGCAVCGLTMQDGCFAIRDANNGLLVPYAASYDTLATQWRQVTPSVCREPDMVKVWYQAGDMADRYLAGVTDDPLSDYWAEAIAMLAAARLPKKVCDCSNLSIVFDELQRDLSAQPPSRTIYLGILAPAMITNPFGSRVGEYRAWLKVAALYGEQAWNGASI